MFGYESSMMSSAQPRKCAVAPGVRSNLLRCSKPVCEDSAKGSSVPSVVVAVTRSLALALFTHPLKCKTFLSPKPL